MLASEKSYAEVVSYRAEGTVTSISGDTSLLPLSSNVGDPITLDFSYDLNETDTNTTVSYSGSYSAISMTVILGSNPSTTVSMPTVRTQSAPFTDLWGINCELGGSTVRLSLFLHTGSVSSDALTVPPSPVPSGTTVQFGFWANDPVGDNDAFVVAQLDQIYISVLAITCSMVEPPLKFVQGVGSNPTSRHLVESTIELANRLSLDIVAEGVETEEQQEYLANYHVKYLQGFLFSKPIPLEEFLREYGKEEGT